MQSVLRNLLLRLRPMPAAAPPASPDPPSVVPSIAVAMPCTSVAVAMPCATPAPPPNPAAADEKRPSRLTKTKLFLARAVSWVFRGMKRRGGVALVGVHAVVVVIKIVTFTTDPEVAEFWDPFFRAMLYLLLAYLVIIPCWNGICYWMEYYEAKQQQQPAEAAAAAVVLLPPPPPAMDMC